MQNYLGNGLLSVNYSFASGYRKPLENKPLKNYFGASYRLLQSGLGQVVTAGVVASHANLDPLGEDGYFQRIEQLVEADALLFTELQQFLLRRSRMADD